MKPASGTRKPYIGHARGLAFDIGMTFSGVSMLSSSSEKFLFSTE